MNAEQIARLKKVVYNQFDKGIDRHRLISALIYFIDENFLDEKDTKAESIGKLIDDIQKYGSYENWKKALAFYIKIEMDKT